MIIDFLLNGKQVSLNIPPQKRLTEILREDCKLFKTRSCCNTGECGNCVVIFNGNLANSCLLPAFKIKDSQIRTIEGFEKTKDYQDIIAGFKAVNYYPCDSCASSRILVTHTLLETNPRPTEQEIIDTLSFIHCSCSDYTGLRDGIFAAGKLREVRKRGR